MVNGRKKGHSFELAVAERFRDAGFPDCVTSRSESKRMDDLGVDLMYTKPWLVQCKAVERLGSVHDVLARMPTDGLRVVFHKRNRKGVTVTMTESDFWKILGMINDKMSDYEKEADREGLPTGG
jgi:hypothetical protein